MLKSKVFTNKALKETIIKFEIENKMELFQKNLLF